jgi:prevent-host-death family protein
MTEVIVASTEFQNRAGTYMEQAAKAPVFITKHNRPVRVLLDIEEYRKLRRSYREALLVTELSDDDMAALAGAPLPPEAEAFNLEMKD